MNRFGSCVFVKNKSYSFYSTHTFLHSRININSQSARDASLQYFKRNSILVQCACLNKVNRSLKFKDDTLFTFWVMFRTQIKYKNKSLNSSERVNNARHQNTGPSILPSHKNTYCFPGKLRALLYCPYYKKICKHKLKGLLC